MGYVVWKLIPKLKLLKNAEPGHFNPTPLYLVVIPVVVLLLQLVLAAPAAEFSRNRAIAKSEELIDGIEAYRNLNGHYPSSLMAVHKDYNPSVVGIERFHYARHGAAYSVFFEQLSFRWGTREFVMYNKLDEHVMSSHTAWLLSWTPDRIPSRQGWYAVHDASTPHWKYFWFD